MTTKMHTKRRIIESLNIILEDVTGTAELKKVIKKCYGDCSTTSRRLFDRDIFPHIEPIVSKDYSFRPNLTRSGKKLYNKKYRFKTPFVMENRFFYHVFNSVDILKDMPAKFLKKPPVIIDKKAKVLSLDRDKILKIWKKENEIHPDTIVKRIRCLKKFNRQSVALTKNDLFKKHIYQYFRQRLETNIYKGELSNFRKILGQDYIKLLRTAEIRDDIDKIMQKNKKDKVMRRFLSLLKNYSVFLSESIVFNDDIRDMKFSLSVIY